MSVPNDPFMLLSYVNTQLRDFYTSFDEMCEELGADKGTIVKKLEKIDYIYDEELNKFV